MSDDAAEKPNIIIDEDWKTQVQNEKEQVHQEQVGVVADNAEDSPATEQLPPASLPFLISTMASQVMAALGQFPDPIDGKTVVRLEFAKHYVDMLTILQEKTTGNRTAEESMLLEEAIHQLRMLYVTVKNSSQEDTSGEELIDKK